MLKPCFAFGKRITLAASFLFASLGTELVAQEASISGLWVNSDNRVETVETTLYRQHCENGRLVWLTHIKTKWATEWEIYTGSWWLDKGVLLYDVSMFERARGPSFEINKRRALNMKFTFSIGSISNERYEFEREYGFARQPEVAKKLSGKVPLPSTLRDKDSCKIQLSNLESN